MEMRNLIWPIVFLVSMLLMALIDSDSDLFLIPVMGLLISLVVIINKIKKWWKKWVDE